MCTCVYGNDRWSLRKSGLLLLPGSKHTTKSVLKHNKLAFYFSIILLPSCCDDSLSHLRGEKLPHFFTERAEQDARHEGKEALLSFDVCVV